jgi:hypothetical protein
MPPLRSLRGLLLRTLILLALALPIVTVGGTWLMRYATEVPGSSHEGPLPLLTAEETALAATLKRHIEAIASQEHNVANYDALEASARYIEGVLEGYGYQVGRQVYRVDGVDVRNIDAVIEPAGANADPEVVVVGAHYDSVEGSPGANDNGSGTAAVLELARLLADLRGKTSKRIRLVLFVNEEPPYFMTSHMGSLHYARMLSERRERVTAMFSLETIGYFSDQAGSQKYPPPFGVMFPDRGNFVSFVGLTNSRPLVQQSIASFRSHTKFPTIGGVAPVIVPGVGWSDHWAFGQYGFQGVMVTDTAPFRYPHYHEPTDTPDKIDTESLARITKGMERVIRGRVTGSQP